ncbi:MAG TPA: DUF885 domain-containing protein [Thermoanaerobaculia bacterium]|nr:DUF885 domain-containing protein [Thermoanaerobaculia bacterium]
MRKWALRLGSAVLAMTGVLGGAVAQAAPRPAEDFRHQFEALLAGKGEIVEGERLARLFDLLWRYELHESPDDATQNGFPGLNDRWPDLSEQAIARRKALLPRILETVRSIDGAGLSPREQIDRDLLEREIADRIAEARFPVEYLAIGPLDGIPQDVPQVFGWMPAQTPADYRDILARLRALPRYVDQTIALLEKGLANGVTPPRVTLRDVPGQVAALIVKPQESELLQAFQKFPPGFPDAERRRMTREAVAVYDREIVPSLQKLHRFLEETYVPGCRESIGMGSLPDGEAWYAYHVRRHTTTDLTPQEIHEIGKAEVARLRAEMDQLIAKTGFTGSYPDFIRYLRTDPRFFFEDPEELVRGYRDIAKRVDPELVRLFGHLPRLPYGVVPVPENAARSQTTAYYEPGAYVAGSSEVLRPGFYYVNTYDLKSRPRWEMEVLTLHESVPGHHLQAALTQELQGMPEWRKHQLYTAFQEGWALYAESLGDEMGLYKDPYAKFGQLTYQMWRAIRLVIDTGIHSMGWSRQQAIGYFRDNAAKTEHDIEVEVDRYLVWPGQALAYKIGEMKIRALRTDAERQLGAAFSVRAFHDEVLGYGAVPLSVLEKNVRTWVEQRRLGASGRRVAGSRP